MADLKIASQQCYTAWEGQNARFAWCYRPNLRLGPMLEAPKIRINHILYASEPHERIPWLNNFRPFVGDLAAHLLQLHADIEAAVAFRAKLWPQWWKYYHEYMQAEANVETAKRLWLEAVNSDQQLAVLHSQQVPGHSWLIPPA